MGITTSVHRANVVYIYGVFYEAEFERYSFAEGTFRKAFRGRLTSKCPLRGQRIVVKALKCGIAHNFSDWKLDEEMMKEAKAYAEEFNQIPLDVTPRRMIRFPAWVDTGRVFDRPGFKFLGLFGDGGNYGVLMNEKVLVEPHLEGRFEKFNSNGGWDSPYGMLLQAFSHWTLKRSRGRTMVCDLQGVKDEQEYRLTDPALHTVDERYAAAKADLGVPGIVVVLLHHKCNDVCRQLGLKPLPFPASMPPFKAGSGTSFSFNLTPAERRRATELWLALGPMLGL
jgi:hypothetical protein